MRALRGGLRRAADSGPSVAPAERASSDRALVRALSIAADPLAALQARWRSRGLRMPRRACIHREPDGRGCPNYARPGSSRCVEHAREQMRNRERSPSSAVSQTHRWRQVRQAVVAERQRPDGTWWCEIGGHVITDRTRIDVDHRQPVAAGGAPYDPDNLRLSCSTHNRRAGGKLRAEQKRQGIAAARARRGALAG